MYKSTPKYVLLPKSTPKHVLLLKSTPKHVPLDKSVPKYILLDKSTPKHVPRPWAHTWDMPSMSSWTSSAWLNCSSAIPTRKTISSPCGKGPRLTPRHHLSHPGFGVFLPKTRPAGVGRTFPHPSGKCGCGPFVIYGVGRGPITSYMKMSKTRVATGRGKVVRKRVRNQDEAYMEVRKLCERKWMFSSGSCSWT